MASKGHSEVIGDEMVLQAILTWVHASVLSRVDCSQYTTTCSCIVNIPVAGDFFGISHRRLFHVDRFESSRHFVVASRRTRETNRETGQTTVSRQQIGGVIHSQHEVSYKLKKPKNGLFTKSLGEKHMNAFWLLWTPIFAHSAVSSLGLINIANSISRRQYFLNTNRKTLIL